MNSLPRTPLTALIVEENRRRNEFLCRTLSERGYHVLSADSFLCAVSILAAVGAPPIDILVTQHRMSQMEGIALARWIHDSHPGLRCLVMSECEPLAQPFPCRSLPASFDEQTLLSHVDGLFAPLAAAA